MCFLATANNMKQFIAPVFYTPAKDGRVPVVIDVARLNSDNVYVGLYNGETLEQITKRYPDASIGESGEIAATSESMMKTEPVEITEEQFHEMLEVLPPEDMQRDVHGSSFKVCEYISGRITSIYVAMGKRYFAFNDLASLPHLAIMEKVKKSLAASEEVSA